jgi:hypothetical protein
VELKTSFILGSASKSSETEDLIIIYTNFLILFPSDSILYLGESIAIAKHYIGFFRLFIFGGIFQAAILSENPASAFTHPLSNCFLNHLRWDSMGR